MTYQGPKTFKTYGRPTDRWPDDLDDVIDVERCQSQGFVGWYYGDVWHVNHKLKTQNLVVTVWVEDSISILNPRIKSYKQLTDTTVQIVWDTAGHPVRGKVIIYALCENSPASDIIHKQDVASDTWVIPHGMGKDYAHLLASFWVAGARADPLLIDHDPMNVTATFMTPCAGTACLVRVQPLRIRNRISKVFIQDTPSTSWVFAHDLGTVDLLSQIWLASPSSLESVTVTETDVFATFSTACTGSLCLMDPFPIKECSIFVRQIVDWPDKFPPGPHTHDKADIPLAQDSVRFDGKESFEYVQTLRDVGIIVCPLILTSDGNRKIPDAYLPDTIPLRVFDTDGAILAKQLRVDDIHSPLYVQKDTVNQTAIISMHFQAQKIDVTGNVSNPDGSVPTLPTTILSGPLKNWTLDVGAGLRATRIDGQTLKLDTAPVVHKYQLPAGVTVLANNGNWVIDDSVNLKINGHYTLTLYETIDAGLPTERKRVVSVGDSTIPGQALIETLPNRIIVYNNTGRHLHVPHLVVMSI